MIAPPKTLAAAAVRPSRTLVAMGCIKFRVLSRESRVKVSINGECRQIDDDGSCWPSELMRPLRMRLTSSLRFRGSEAWIQKDNFFAARSLPEFQVRQLILSNGEGNGETRDQYSGPVPLRYCLERKLQPCAFDRSSCMSRAWEMIQSRRRARIPSPSISAMQLNLCSVCPPLQLTSSVQDVDHLQSPI
jgi:hypothetical protein